MKTIEAKGGYIFVQYDEVYSKSVLFDLIEKTYKMSKELNCRKLLADISKMTGKVSTMDRFEFGVYGSCLYQDGYMIAVVYSEEEINRFAETVSVNRGVNARVFSDIDKALEWLGIENNKD
jgi:hypothetical protein